MESRILWAGLVVWMALLPRGEAVDVTDWGVPRDGESDATEGIRHVLERAGDGVVRFPKGEYRLTEPIEIRLETTGPISLEGSGGSARILMAGPGPAFRFIGTHGGTANPDGFADGVWRRERMPQVRGLEIVGRHPEADGLEFIRVMQPTMDGVLLRELRHGVRFGERNRNPIVTGCHIYDCSGVGVFLDRVNLHQMIVEGSHISYCDGGGIKVVGSEIRNLQITGNDIEYNYDPDAEASADIWIDTTDGTVREGTIASNTIQARPSPGGANIRFDGASVPQDEPGLWSNGLWTITGNLISNQRVNIHLKGARGVTVTGNTIFTATDRTVLVEGSRNIILGSNALDQSHNHGREMTNGITVRDSHGVSIHGIQLEAAGPETENGGAVEIHRSRRVSLQDCQITGGHPHGILVRESPLTRIGGCMIVDEQEPSRLRGAVRVVGNSKPTTVRGNMLAAGRDGSVLDPGRNATVEGNRTIEDR